MSARHLRRYILPGERVVLATRAHWGKLAEPVGTTFASFLLVAWLVVASGPTLGDGALMLWWVWLAVALRLLWKVLDWRNEWFVATDKRMLLMFGLVTHKVAMMPLGKVTDMSYSRSIVGRVLGYGQFILESAGQDQAMSRINWVAKPDATYRQLCDTIFIRADGAGRRVRRGRLRRADPSPLPRALPPGPWFRLPATRLRAPCLDPDDHRPELDPTAAATQPVAVRSLQDGGQGHLFVALGAAPATGRNRPAGHGSPPPPLPAERRT
ncbi:PH domain-containing protein [Oerskovia sp. M15]